MSNWRIEKLVCPLAAPLWHGHLAHAFDMDLTEKLAVQIIFTSAADTHGRDARATRDGMYTLRSPIPMSCLTMIVGNT
jgi:hypothetical protein